MDEWLNDWMDKWVDVLERNGQIDSLHFSYAAVSVKPSKDTCFRGHSVLVSGILTQTTLYILRVKEVVFLKHYP